MKKEKKQGRGIEEGRKKGSCKEGKERQKPRMIESSRGRSGVRKK
jgi:hypothetical protein